MLYCTLPHRPHPVIPAKAGIHTPAYRYAGLAGVLDSVLSLPKGAGMTGRGQNDSEGEDDQWRRPAAPQFVIRN